MAERHCTCPRCGAGFRTSNNQKQYCSKYCGQLDWIDRRKAEGKHQKQIQKWCAVHTGTCEMCGNAYCKKPSPSKVCDKCLPDYKAKKRESFLKAARDSARVEDKARSCAVCGCEFIAEYTGGRRQVFCSDECRHKKKREYSRTGKKKRKYKIRGVRVESVNYLRVLDRDKWTCRLCGTKTPKRLRGTYQDNAPEIDHIIPIAMGGEHSYSNTQCACRKCNATKGASPLGQLMLFG